MKNEEIQAIDNVQNIKIGKVVYRLKSIHTGQKDLKKIIEKLTIESVINEVSEFKIDI